MAAGSGTEQLKQGELYRTGALQQGFRYVRRHRTAAALRTAQSRPAALADPTQAYRADMALVN